MTLIVFMYALFGSSFPIAKLLLGYTTPLFLLASRLLMAGPILLGYQYIWGRHAFRFEWKHTWYLAQIVVLGMYLNYLLRFWALNDLPSWKVSFLFNASPFFSAIYSYIFFKEKMTRNQWIGLAIGCLGLVPILVTTSAAEESFGQLFFMSWQELFVLAAVGLHTYCYVLIRLLIKDHAYTPMMINGMSMTLGGLMALATCFATGEYFPVEKPLPFLQWLVAIVLISNIICHNLYGYLLRFYSATFLAFAGFMGPLFSALYGWGLLGETITWHFFASCMLVFVGLYLFHKDELARMKTDETVH
jgi:drug/metabolite transporter (DMT)-like permease